MYYKETFSYDKQRPVCKWQSYKNIKIFIFGLSRSEEINKLCSFSVKTCLPVLFR
jgi:hypothetical protein